MVVVMTLSEAAEYDHEATAVALIALGLAAAVAVSALLTIVYVVLAVLGVAWALTIDGAAWALSAVVALVATPLLGLILLVKRSTRPAGCGVLIGYAVGVLVIWIELNAFGAALD